MNFERYCGMASAAMLLSIWAFVTWTGLWGPIWTAAYEMKASDALGVIVAAIGWIVTVAAAAVAYLVAQKQINLQQRQIRDAQVELAQAAFERVNKQVDDLAADIDTMFTAQGFLQNYVSNFPDKGNIGGWTRALWATRRTGDDVLSFSAANAPFGYGPRVTTVVSRLQRMGDALFQETTVGRMPFNSAELVWDQPIRAAVVGMSNLISQMREEAPKRRHELGILITQRDLYAERVETLLFDGPAK